MPYRLKRPCLRTPRQTARSRRGIAADRDTSSAPLGSAANARTMTLINGFCTRTMRSSISRLRSASGDVVRCITLCPRSMHLFILRGRLQERTVVALHLFEIGTAGARRTRKKRNRRRPTHSRLLKSVAKLLRRTFAAHRRSDWHCQALNSSTCPAAPFAERQRRAIWDALKPSFQACLRMGGAIVGPAHEGLQK